MREPISDEAIRDLAHGALRLYDGFDEIYRPLLVEAVLRQLPAEFDRRRVERVLEQMVPYQM